MDESKSARSGQPLSSTAILISPPIAGTDMGREKNFTGQHFWARGYFVTSVGEDEKTIRDGTLLAFIIFLAGRLSFQGYF
jgi:REP element-mobilizing transposase RayT